MSDGLGEHYDVVVIGGGAAGLNGGLTLARSRRAVAVIDSGAPRNAPAAAVHGVLGHDGRSPGELLARGRDEVRSYGGHVVDATVADVRPAGGDGFVVSLADGRSTRARRLLVTTGVVDRLPAVAGLPARWGRDVLHCPYCHGWEVRDQAIGILATGPRATHHALLFHQLSADVVVFGHECPPEGEQAEELAALGVEVIHGEVVAIEVVEDRLAGVRLADGTVVARQVLAVASRLEARADFLAGIGLAAVEHPSGMGEHVPVDALGRTSVPGVWAAGNVADPGAQVGAAAAAGNLAAAHINADLAAEEARQAAANRRR